MADIQVTEVKDPRMDFIQDYTLRSLRLKPDKWQRMVVSNEQMAFITGFVENGYPQVSICKLSYHILIRMNYSNINAINRCLLQFRSNYEYLSRKNLYWYNLFIVIYLPFVKICFDNKYFDWSISVEKILSIFVTL